MVDTYIGSLRLFPYGFAPRNYAYCQGQTMNIQSNTALFAVLGITYGGNGQQTFGLPDLRGRTPINNGQSPGNSNYPLGALTGVENVTLLSTQMPSHSHLPLAKVPPPGTSTGMDHVPLAGDYLSRYMPSPSAVGFGWNNPPLDNPSTLAPSAIGIQGGSQAHPNMQPFLTLAWCICLFGVFPTRN